MVDNHWSICSFSYLITEWHRLPFAPATVPWWTNVTRFKASFRHLWSVLFVYFHSICMVFVFHACPVWLSMHFGIQQWSNEFDLRILSILRHLPTRLPTTDTRIGWCQGFQALWEISGKRYILISIIHKNGNIEERPLLMEGNMCVELLSCIQSEIRNFTAAEVLRVSEQLRLCKCLSRTPYICHSIIYLQKE